MLDAQRRSSMQDFRNFPLYLTAQLWDQLESSTATVSQLRKVELLCNYLVQSLGMRHASEPTQSVIVALIGRRMDVAQQSALLQTIKSVLRTVVTRAKHMGVQLPGNTFLDVLPAGQDELPAAYRAHLQTLQIVPVPPAVNVEEIWQMARATPLRARNQQLVLQQAMQGQGLSPSTGSLALQQNLLTQTASMMVQALAGVMQPRPEETALRNLRLFPRTAAAETAAPRGEALQRLLERADTSSSNLSVASAPCRSQQAASAAPPLALRDGSVAEGTPPAVLVAEAAASPAARVAVETMPGAVVAASAGLAERVPVEIDGEGVTAPEMVEGGQAAVEMPSSVADSVQKLAQAHYGKELPAGAHPTGKKPRVKAVKRPASAAKVLCKKPASKEDILALEVDTEEKKGSLVAASAKKRPGAALKQSAKKRPAAAGASAGSSAAGLKPLSERRRFELQPNGCATCRGRPGCCRSCWAKRGFLACEVSMEPLQRLPCSEKSLSISLHVCTCLSFAR
jgi:hypothetical protein